MKSRTKNIVAILIIFSVTALLATYSYQISTKRINEENIYKSIFAESEIGKNVIFSSAILNTCIHDKTNRYGYPQKAFDNFIIANQPGAKLNQLNSLSGILPLAKWEDTKLISRTGKYNHIQLGNETLLILLSRAGFSDDHTKAVVCIEYNSIEHGYTTILHVEKKNNVWEIENEERTLIRN